MRTISQVITLPRDPTIAVLHLDQSMPLATYIWRGFFRLKLKTLGQRISMMAQNEECARRIVPVLIR